MKKFKIAWVILVAVMAVIFSTDISMAGNARQELVEDSVIEQVMKRGFMRVGMSTFVPWAMKDKEGNLIGFEIDVASRLAQDMGVKIEFIPTKWSGIIPALLTGKFDVIIGGMGIRPDRNLKVNFSIPYDYSGQSMMAHKELAKGFNKLSDFDSPEVSIAARIGTTAATAAKKFMPKAQLKLFDDESQAVQELLNGRVHAMVASAPLPAFQVIKNPEKLFLPLEDFFTKEPNGFAIRKSDLDTLNYFNNWIRFVEAEGWLKERKEYWFGTRDWENQIN
ncbi:MAG: transporter substrate-binding domain-containing protein [Desulfobacterales bacterium]